MNPLDVMSEENTMPEMQAQPSAPETGAAGAMYSESDVENLKRALKAEREARKQHEREAKERAAQLERFAEINPDEYQALQAEAAKAAQLQAQFGEAREAIEAKYSRQAEEASMKAQAAEQALAEYRKKYAMEKIFYAAGGRTESADGISFIDMLADQIGNRFRQEPDGSLTVIDAQGDPVLDKESGKRISPEDFIASYKNHAIYGTFFKGTKGSGAGLGYGGTDANGMPVQDLSQLSPSELFQVAFGK